MKLAIIVPAYNAAETIEECLTAVIAAIGKRNDCEVIVVDDASDDGTQEIAGRFPVEVVRLERNEGRIRAREIGARAARAEQLLFVDTRVIIPPDSVRVLEEIGYEPIVVRTAPQDPATSTALNRVLELIRKRAYAPYYPPPPGFSRIFLNAENFFEVPKGTGALYVDKARFLAALPEDRSQFVSDDTRIFRAMIDEKEIMIPEEISIEYLPRNRLWNACRHLYQRGPRFADFHLQPGGRYYPLWVFLSFSLLAVMAAVIAGAMLSGASGALARGGAVGVEGEATGAVASFTLLATLAVCVIALAILSLIALSAYLAETFADFFRVLFVLPLITVSFGLGVLRGKLRQLTRAPGRTWNRWLLFAIIGASLILAYSLWGRGAVNLAEMRWRRLVPLALIHLGILTVNGLVLRRFLRVFGICLRPAEWFGLAVVTSMGSYLATGAGGMMVRAAVLRHKFNLEYSKFMALLTVNYLLNVLVVSLLGLGAFAAYYGRTGFDAWAIPVLLLLAGVVAFVLPLTRPLPRERSGPVARLISQLHEGWEILSQNPVALIQVAGLLTINLVLQAAALRVAFSVFSFELEPAAALLLAALSSFAIFFAVTPANLGIQEGFTSVASFVVGSGFAEGLAAMSMLRAVAILNVFVLGPIFSYLLLKKEQVGKTRSDAPRNG